MNCTSITNLSFSLSLIGDEKTISDGTIDALKKRYNKKRVIQKDLMS